MCYHFDEQPQNGQRNEHINHLFINTLTHKKDNGTTTKWTQ